MNHIFKYKSVTLNIFYCVKRTIQPGVIQISYRVGNGCFQTAGACQHQRRRYRSQVQRRRVPIIFNDFAGKRIPHQHIVGSIVDLDRAGDFFRHRQKCLRPESCPRLQVSRKFVLCLQFYPIQRHDLHHTALARSKNHLYAVSQQFHLPGAFFKNHQIRYIKLLPTRSVAERYYQIVFLKRSYQLAAISKFAGFFA